MDRSAVGGAAQHDPGRNRELSDIRRVPSRRTWLVITGAALLALCVLGLFGVPPLIELLAAHVGKGRPGMVSFELADAPAGATPEIRVAGWLRVHRSELAASEGRFRVDRRAIAAAIAYEAIADPRTGAFAYAARFSGPGKVHYREFRLTEGNPASKQAEDAGLLPRLGALERKNALTHARVAIDYIGAIMSLFVKKSGRMTTACDIPLLTTLYTSTKPSDYARHDDASVPENVAGAWAERHVQYLTDAAGTPSEKVCQQ